MTGPRYGVIVDAFYSGTKLPARFRDHGYRLIHLQSRSDIPYYDRVGFDPGLYHDCLMFDGALAQLVSRLETVSPEFVLAGGEYGVTLTDRLADALNVPGNDPALSRCRRYKFHMARRLAEVGVPSALSFDARTLAEALDASRQIGTWPVVVKPRDGASSEGIHFCRSEAELRRSFMAEIGKRNEMNVVNTTLLIMEYLAGRQYTVQSTTLNGRHHVSEIWLDRRHPVAGHGAVYDMERLLPAKGEVQDRVRDHACRVLDALGVRQGPGYQEITMTQPGPILMEATSRLMGCQDHAAVASVKGTDALSLCVACYADPDSYSAATAEPYSLRRELAIVSTINRVSGTITDDGWQDEMRALPTFLGFLRKPKIGDTVAPTVDLLSNYAVIYLCGQDWQAIERDYTHLRAMDARPGGMFRIATTQSIAMPKDERGRLGASA